MWLCYKPPCPPLKVLEIYSGRAGEKGVMCFVGKRPDRICNPLIAYAFLGISDVKWVCLDDSDSAAGATVTPRWMGTAGRPSVFGGTWDWQVHAGVGINPGLPRAGNPQRTGPPGHQAGDQNVALKVVGEDPRVGGGSGRAATRGGASEAAERMR
jgi:hypothetical protein